MPPPIPPVRATLFQAIVASGVAMTGCGGEATSPPAVPPPAVPSSESNGDAAATKGDAGTDAGCPAGAELPVPPCYLIR